MKFTIIHPTARFDPEQQHFWAATMKDWLSKCDNPQDVEYLLVVHSQSLGVTPVFVVTLYAQWLSTWSHSKTVRPFEGWGHGEVLVNRDRCCLADQLNCGISRARGEILIRVDDDMYPPEHWDTILSAAVPETALPVCVHVRHGSPRENTLFLPMICTRELQNRMGLIDPAYDHMYLDDEFTAQAQKLGAVVHLQDMFEHRNPAWGKSENDPVYEQANRAAVYQLDKITFDRRKAAGFPRIPIPGWPAPKEPGMGIVDKAKRAWRGLSDLNPPPVSGVLLRRTLALCLPGEIFHHQWVASMFNLQGAIGECGFTSLCFMGYCASPHVTRMMMSESILNTVRGDAACPYLFWLDDDNVAPPELIKRWISEFDSNPQMDILCGWCWIQRGEAWSTSLAFCGPEGIENRWLTLADVFKGGPNIREVPKLLSGFPCVMMRREVLEKLGPQAFIPIPHDGATYGQISEDFSFFYRAMQAGMRVFVDPLGKVGHLKTISQEPTIELPADAPQAVKQWRDSIRGKPVQAPKEFQRVEA